MILNGNNIKYEHFAFISAAIIVTSSALVYYFTKQDDNSVDNALKTIPMPKGAYPYVGHLLSFNKFAGFKFKEWHDDLGPVIQVRMGVYTWIIINDSYIAHELFVTNGAVASNRTVENGIIKYVTNNKRGLAYSKPNSQWNTYRSAARLTFGSLSAIDKHESLFQTGANMLINTLIEACSPQSLAETEKNEEKTNSVKTQDVDPYDSLFFYTVNNVLQMCFGTRVRSPDDLLYQDIMAFIDGSKRHLAVGYGPIGFLPILSFRQELKDCETFYKEMKDGLFHTLVDCASRSTEECMFQRLCQQREEHDLKDDDLLQASGDIMVAGAEPPLATILWIIAILLHYPDVRKQLGAEVDAFIRRYKRLPKFSERDQLPFTISVQKECMRYRPILHLSVPHSLDKNVQCQGYVFPKDIPIFSLIYGHYRDSKRYHKPDEFIPDRFINSTNKTMSSAAAGKIEDRDNFTFGWGRRVCPGALLAETMIFNVMTSMFAYCTLKPPMNGHLPDINNYQYPGISIMPPPFKVQFIRRPDCLLP